MENVSTLITGGCLCGAIRYESDQPPIRVGYCHCGMCKKALGNLFGTAADFSSDHFRFVSGELAWYASSESVKRGFCAHCGSPVAYQHRDAPHVTIWVGTLDRPEEHEPRAHWYTGSKISWVDIHAELPDETAGLTSQQSKMTTRE